MIVSNPINALVPFAAEILKKHNTFDARRLFGVTTLDVVRAETFLAEMLGTISKRGAGVEVTVVGGHSAETMVPLFSQLNVAKKLSSEQVDELTHRELLPVVQLFLRSGNTADVKRHPDRRHGGILGEGPERWRDLIDCLCCTPVHLTTYIHSKAILHRAY